MSRTHPLARLETLLLIAVGGFAGSNLRYFAILVIPSSLLAVLVVNVLGSFALGVILYDATRKEILSKQASVVFGTGFLASFTTYSEFALGAFTASPGTALAYVGTSYVLGFVAVLAARATVIRVEDL